LQMVRYSCFSVRLNDEYLLPLERRLKDKFGGTYHFSPVEEYRVGRIMGLDIYSAWVRGKYIKYLTSHQFEYLKSLCTILDKVDRL